MFFTGKDGYQNFLVFASILSFLVLDSNRKVSNWVSTGVSSAKTKTFDISIVTTMPNLANSRVM